MERSFMADRFSIAASGLAFLAKRAWTAVTRACCKMIVDDAHAYRPEAHYMRGPGPKWREKHAREGNAAA
jgi:hypothetical protein